MIKPTLLVVLGAWLADAAPIDTNPVTLVDDVVPLTHKHPAFGAAVPAAVVAYTVSESSIGTSNATTLAATTAGGEGTVHAGRARELEATSADIERLEEHFNAKMVINFKTLQQAQYKVAGAPTAPWPSSYWPVYQDGINAKWNPTDKSPSEKYALAFGLDVAKFTTAVSQSNGILSMSTHRACTATTDCDSLKDGSICGKRDGEATGRCIPAWFGICHAWAPAAILEPEPKCAVTRGNVTFQPFDIKALMTQIYDGASIDTVFTGARFNGADEPANKDKYGRYKDDARRDLGPGFFHIAISNIMGKFKQSFVVDVTAGAEVWNQPVRGYQVLEMNEVDPATAAMQYFNVRAYPFNSAAKKLAYVKTKFDWIVEAIEDGPLVTSGRMDAFTQSATYEYLLELDNARNIIGGEWVGESRYNHPDFLWFATERPAQNTVTALGLKYKDVRKLLDEAVQCQATPEPTTVTPEPTTVTPEPTTATPEPTTATPEPTTATPEPTTVTPEPTTATPEPTTATPEPTTVTPEPTTVAPTTTTPEPTTVTPEPTTVAPTTTTPEPTTVTPEPTTVTPEPTTVAPTTAPVPATSQPTTPVPTVDATPEPTTVAPTTTTPEPTTSKPATPEPSTSEPTTPTTTPEPTTAEPTTPVTTTPTPTTSEPANGTPEPTTVAPTTPVPTTSEPTTPVTTTPTTTAPTTTAPTTPEPTTLEPVTPEPTTSEPTLEPTTPEPTTLAPTTSEPTTPAPTTLAPTSPPTSQCGPVQVGVDFFGDDIRQVRHVRQSDCCGLCSKTTGCKAYTFIRGTCYLKKGKGKLRAHPHATSSVVSSPLNNGNNPQQQQQLRPVAPDATCTNQVGSSCGNQATGAQCCPTGAYCQPKTPWLFQCVQSPPRCPMQQVNVDFYGANIKLITGVSAAECCDLCARTSGCKAYTFLQYTLHSGAVCHLKSSVGTPRFKAGAVSATVTGSSANTGPQQW